MHCTQSENITLTTKKKNNKDYLPSNIWRYFEGVYNIQ